MGKKLIINADDYGLCREVNEAIEGLVTLGRLRNVSVLANSSCYEESVEFLSHHAQCSIGAHLNVVEGVALSGGDTARILVDNNGEFVNFKQLILRWFGSPFRVVKAVEKEWREQIELMLKDGLNISHADSHQHIHAFPPFWKLLTRLCHDYGIPALRRPSELSDLSLRPLSSFVLSRSMAASETMSADRSLISNDHFLGFKRAGSYGEAELICDIKNLKDGITELIVHPSIHDGMPYQAYRGEVEYEGLQSVDLYTEIERASVELVTWTDVAGVCVS